MVEARKIKSITKYLKGQAPCFVRKELSPKLSKKVLFSIAGSAENIRWTVTSVESYHWFKRFFHFGISAKHFLCKNVP